MAKKKNPKNSDDAAKYDEPTAIPIEFDDAVEGLLNTDPIKRKQVKAEGFVETYRGCDIFKKAIGRRSGPGASNTPSIEEYSARVKGQRCWKTSLDDLKEQIDGLLTDFI